MRHEILGYQWEDIGEKGIQSGWVSTSQDMWVQRVEWEEISIGFQEAGTSGDNYAAGNRMEEENLEID